MLWFILVDTGLFCLILVDQGLFLLIFVDLCSSWIILDYFDWSGLTLVDLGWYGPFSLPMTVPFTLLKPGTHQKSCFERAGRSWIPCSPVNQAGLLWLSYISLWAYPPLYCIPLYSALSHSLYNTPGGWCLYTYLWPGITTSTHTTTNPPHIHCGKWFNKFRKAAGIYYIFHVA